MLRSLIVAVRLSHRCGVTGTKAHPNSLMNYFLFLASFLFPLSSCFHFVVMKLGDAAAERFPSECKQCPRSRWRTSHPQEHVPGVCLGGAFVNTSCGKVLRLLGADMRDISVWASCLYLGLESPAAAMCHTRLRSFTPLTPACSVNTVAVCVFRFAGRMLGPSQTHTHTLTHAHTTTQSVPWHRFWYDQHATQLELVWFWKSIIVS